MKAADATARASLFGSSRFVTADGKGERQQGRSSTAPWNPGESTREKRIMSVIRKEKKRGGRTIADEMLSDEFARVTRERKLPALLRH